MILFGCILKIYSEAGKKLRWSVVLTMAKKILYINSW